MFVVVRSKKVQTKFQSPAFLLGSVRDTLGDVLQFLGALARQVRKAGPDQHGFHAAAAGHEAMRLAGLVAIGDPRALRCAQSLLPALQLGRQVGVHVLQHRHRRLVGAVQLHIRSPVVHPGADVHFRLRLRVLAVDLALGVQR